MCGVVGVWSLYGLGSPTTVEAKLADMAAMLAHRGPDGQGVWTDGVVGLGHARLAVIDLSDSASQPMTDVGGAVHISYNGEIYNYKELRRELIEFGHEFHTASDTEVIIEGYKKWGTGVLERLRGMFALALWDAKVRKFIVARDRLGQKPLYYHQGDGILLIASEIKGLLAWPGVDRTPNLSAINQYLTFQYVPTPNTAFNGIHMLPPATAMIVDAGGQTDMFRYWSLPIQKPPESDPKTVLRKNSGIVWTKPLS